MPGQRQQRAAYVVAVGAAVEHHGAVGERAGEARRAPGRGRAASAATLGLERRPAWRRRGRGGSGPARASRCGRPCSATMPPGDRARPGDADLLADDGADGGLGAVDLAGDAQAGRRPHERAEQRVRAELARRRRPGRSRRRAGGGRARSRRRCRAGRAARTSAATKPVPPPARQVVEVRAGRCRGRAAARACGRSCRARPTSTPGTTWNARKSRSRLPANGVRTASRIVTAPDGRAVARPATGRARAAASATRRRPRGRSR